MKTSKVKALVLGAFLGTVLLAGVATTPAEAQTRVVRRPSRVIIYRPYYHPFYHPFYNPFWGSYWGPTYTVVDPIAYQKELGYREGLDEGKDDAKDGRFINPVEHKDYLKSESQAFRQMFVQGYQAGYREEVAKIKEKMREKGRDKGKEDARKGRVANPAIHKDYQKATRHDYRQEFVNGYNERYRQEIAKN